MRTALVACWLSAATVAPAAGRAEGFFVGQELDYWDEVQGRRTADAAKASDRPLRPLDAGEFRWEDYDDPTTDVFWDDGGNYVPPRPLRIAAADPTPENVARYMRWQKRKLDVIATFQQEVARQTGMPTGRGLATTAGGRVSVPPGDAETIRQRGAPIDWRRLDVVFFYASSCPHCAASVDTVRELERLGARVIPVQTDWREREPLLPGSVQYTAEIAKEQPIDAVPTWIASYGGDRLTMQGRVTVQSIELTVKMAQQQRTQDPTQPDSGG